MSSLRHVIARRTACLSAMALLVQGCGAAQARQEPATVPGPEVALDSGMVRGVDDGDVLRYRGIRYARPPVGQLRWRPPQPMARWRGVVPATASGPACPQDNGNPKERSDAEDCLTLDVTVPKEGAKRKPVMVWLHGGGFVAGRGADYDPRRLAAQGDVVVVTVEFRLGVLGYLALPGMAGGGTFGLQDQQAALRWVQRNAAAFGGDAGNVTLFGESGGGIATCGHLTAPGSRGLFAKAIIQSGSCGTVLLPMGGAPRLPFWRSMKESRAATRTAATRLGCPAGRDTAQTLACLRGKPVKELLSQTGLFQAAAYGGRALPASPERALRAGDFARVPVLSGHTSKEALLFAATLGLAGSPITDENLPALVREGFGSRADDIARRYSREDYATASEAWAAPYTDAVFACPHAEDRDALARRVPVYAYVFGDDTVPPFIPSLPGFPAGAGHASELLYLFDVKDKPISLDGKRVPLTALQQSVARDMVAAWTSFARSGTPSVGGKPWPRWAPKAGSGRVARLVTERPGSTATTPAPACDHFN
ncbi:carboxylesterase family protein [Nonomuraea sp. NPDC050202]|uniref:carboxylesterase/lipase family protein n=1 Tax=Nonomuraea sp. NPDC050202 TaxID=3155035 RepID=UPI0033F9CCA8